MHPTGDATSFDWIIQTERKKLHEKDREIDTLKQRLRRQEAHAQHSNSIVTSLQEENSRLQQRLTTMKETMEATTNDVNAAQGLRQSSLQSINTEVRRECERLIDKHRRLVQELEALQEENHRMRNMVLTSIDATTTVKTSLSILQSQYDLLNLSVSDLNRESFSDSINPQSLLLRHSCNYCSPCKDNSHSESKSAYSSPPSNPNSLLALTSQLSESQSNLDKALLQCSSLENELRVCRQQRDDALSTIEKTINRVQLLEHHHQGKQGHPVKPPTETRAWYPTHVDESLLQVDLRRYQQQLSVCERELQASQQQVVAVTNGYASSQEQLIILKGQLQAAVDSKQRLETERGELRKQVETLLVKQSTGSGHSYRQPVNQPSSPTLLASSTMNRSNSMQDIVVYDPVLSASSAVVQSPSPLPSAVVPVAACSARALVARPSFLREEVEEELLQEESELEAYSSGEELVVRNGLYKRKVKGEVSESLKRIEKYTTYEEKDNKLGETKYSEETQRQQMIETKEEVFQGMTMKQWKKNEKELNNEGSLKQLALTNSGDVGSDDSESDNEDSDASIEGTMKKGEIFLRELDSPSSIISKPKLLTASSDVGQPLLLIGSGVESSEYHDHDSRHASAGGGSLALKTSLIKTQKDLEVAKADVVALRVELMTLKVTGGEDGVIYLKQALDIEIEKSTALTQQLSRVLKWIGEEAIAMSLIRSATGAPLNLHNINMERVGCRVIEYVLSLQQDLTAFQSKLSTTLSSKQSLQRKVDAADNEALLWKGKAQLLAQQCENDDVLIDELRKQLSKLYEQVVVVNKVSQCDCNTLLSRLAVTAKDMGVYAIPQQTSSLQYLQSSPPPDTKPHSDTPTLFSPPPTVTLPHNPRPAPSQADVVRREKEIESKERQLKEEREKQRAAEQQRQREMEMENQRLDHERVEKERQRAARLEDQRTLEEDLLRSAKASTNREQEAREAVRRRLQQEAEEKLHNNKRIKKIVTTETKIIRKPVADNSDDCLYSGSELSE